MGRSAEGNLFQMMQEVRRVGLVQNCLSCKGRLCSALWLRPCLCRIKKYCTLYVNLLKSLQIHICDEVKKLVIFEKTYVTLGKIQEVSEIQNIQEIHRPKNPGNPEMQEIHQKTQDILEVQKC